MKKVCFHAVVALLILAFAGCAGINPYSEMMGPYYLNQRDYDAGIKAFKKSLQEDPANDTAAYYIGRYYLAKEEPDQAMKYLQKAATLQPENADYRFWIGVAHWAKLEFEQEQAAYEQALALDPNHISANLYYGHGFVDAGEWEEALAQYNKVLSLDEYNPQGLYNRAVALGGLGREKEEKAALKKFLEFYPDGSLAMRATARLNLLGDFTYRNFILGKRNVTLRGMAFKPGTSELEYASKESLHVIAAMLSANDDLGIHVVAYKDGDAATAKARAKAVRDYILSGRPELDPQRLPLSWFGVAETVQLEGKTFTLEDSVQFITVTN